MQLRPGLTVAWRHPPGNHEWAEGTNLGGQCVTPLQWPEQSQRYQGIASSGPFISPPACLKARLSLLKPLGCPHDPKGRPQETLCLSLLELLIGEVRKDVFTIRWQVISDTAAISPFCSCPCHGMNTDPLPSPPTQPCDRFHRRGAISKPRSQRFGNFRFLPPGTFTLLAAAS